MARKKGKIKKKRVFLLTHQYPLPMESRYKVEEVHTSKYNLNSVSVGDKYKLGVEDIPNRYNLDPANNYKPSENYKVEEIGSADGDNRDEKLKSRYQATEVAETSSDSKYNTLSVPTRYALTSSEEKSMRSEDTYERREHTQKVGASKYNLAQDEEGENSAASRYNIKIAPAELHSMSKYQLRTAPLSDRYRVKDAEESFLPIGVAVPKKLIPKEVRERKLKSFSSLHFQEEPATALDAPKSARSNSTLGKYKSKKKYQYKYKSGRYTYKSDSIYSPGPCESEDFDTPSNEESAGDKYAKFSKGSTELDRSTSRYETGRSEEESSYNESGSFEQGGNVFHWNDKFIQIIDMPPGPKQQERLAKLAQDFHFCAKQFGEIIITERYLSEEQKTIKTASLGGIAGGEVWFFLFAKA